jgi:hypothetical protein
VLGFKRAPLFQLRACVVWRAARRAPCVRATKDQNAAVAHTHRSARRRTNNKQTSPQCCTREQRSMHHHSRPQQGQKEGTQNEAHNPKRATHRMSGEFRVKCAWYPTHSTTPVPMEKMRGHVCRAAKHRVCMHRSVRLDTVYAAETEHPMA